METVVFHQLESFTILMNCSWEICCVQKFWIHPWFLFLLCCCCCSIIQSYLTLSNPMDCSMPGIPVLHCLPEFAQTRVHWFDDVNQLILCHPLLQLPLIFSCIRVFSNELALCIRWPKYWSFSFSISPSNEHSVLISFRFDWFDLLDVQETLKSLLQHYSLKASVLQCSAFFIVQLSHPYMTTEKKHSFDHMNLYQQSNVCAF